MKTGEIVFCIIIAVWMFVGMVGGLRAKENRINYELILFMIFSLFIPLVAKMYGLV